LLVNYNLLHRNGKSDSRVHSISDRQLLALDAMSKLANQFSNKPDFDKLISTLLLTLSGQFTVSNLFTILYRPGFHESKSAYFAFGKFKDNASLKSLKLTIGLRRYFLEFGNGSLIDEINTNDYEPKFKDILKKQQVEIICPIIHGDNLIGLMGMGRILPALIIFGN